MGLYQGILPSYGDDMDSLPAPPLPAASTLERALARAKGEIPLSLAAPTNNKPGGPCTVRLSGANFKRKLYEIINSDLQNDWLMDCFTFKNSCFS